MNRIDTDLRLLQGLIKNSLSRAFKIESLYYSENHSFIATIKFTNGIIWRCIPHKNAENPVYKLDDQLSTETVIVKTDLIECDIKKACYEVSFYRTNGELIYRSKETITPSEILKNLF